MTLTRSGRELGTESSCRQYLLGLDILVVSCCCWLMEVILCYRAAPRSYLAEIVCPVEPINRSKSSGS